MGRLGRQKAEHVLFVQFASSVMRLREEVRLQAT
jgi:hypothetical protein